jgi:hypothetical protein
MIAHVLFEFYTIFSNPETASRVGGVGVRKGIRPQNIRLTPVYATSPIVRKREIWLIDISGKPSNTYCSAEKRHKTMMMMIKLTSGLMPANYNCGFMYFAGFHFNAA